MNNNDMASVGSAQSLSVFRFGASLLVAHSAFVAAVDVSQPTKMLRKEPQVSRTGAGTAGGIGSTGGELTGVSGFSTPSSVVMGSGSDSRGRETAQLFHHRGASEPSAGRSSLVELGENLAGSLATDGPPAVGAASPSASSGLRAELTAKYGLVTMDSVQTRFKEGKSHLNAVADGFAVLVDTITQLEEAVVALPRDSLTTRSLAQLARSDGSAKWGTATSRYKKARPELVADRYSYAVPDDYSSGGRNRGIGDKSNNPFGDYYYYGGGGGGGSFNQIVAPGSDENSVGNAWRRRIRGILSDGSSGEESDGGNGRTQPTSQVYY